MKLSSAEKPLLFVSQALFPSEHWRNKAEMPKLIYFSFEINTDDPYSHISHWRKTTHTWTTDNPLTSLSVNESAITYEGWGLPPLRWCSVVEPPLRFFKEYLACLPGDSHLNLATLLLMNLSPSLKPCSALSLKSDLWHHSQTIASQSRLSPASVSSRLRVFIEVEGGNIRVGACNCD